MATIRIESSLTKETDDLNTLIARVERHYEEDEK